MAVRRRGGPLEHDRRASSGPSLLSPRFACSAVQNFPHRVTVGSTAFRSGIRRLIHGTRSTSTKATTSCECGSHDTEAVPRERDHRRVGGRIRDRNEPRLLQRRTAPVLDLDRRWHHDDVGIVVLDDEHHDDRSPVDRRTLTHRGPVPQRVVGGVPGDAHRQRDGRALQRGDPPDLPLPTGNPSGDGQHGEDRHPRRAVVGTPELPHPVDEARAVARAPR